MKQSVWILNTNVPSFVVAVVAVVSILVTGDRLTITECEPTGQISISEDGYTHSTFTCEVFHANETAIWALRLRNVRYYSFRCGPIGQPCDTQNSFVNVSRPLASSSTLTIERNYSKQLGFDVVICASLQNPLDLYTCNISVISHPASTTLQTHLPITSAHPASTTLQTHLPITSAHPASTTLQTHLPITSGLTTEGEQNAVSRLFSTATTDDHTQENLEMAPAKDPFPSAAVGGGVAAAVVIVVVVAVVFYKRRSQESGKTRKQTVDTGDYDNSAVSDAATIEASARGPYASLEMSEVGLRSVYSDLTHSSPASQSAHPGDCASLQMSYVGMNSTYSVLGQHVGVAPVNDGTDYEIPP